MTDFLPTEKGVPIRMPSTANLLVDSSDRDPTRDLLSNNFLINKKNSILNGYFSRIGVTEMNLRWTTPNVSADLTNNFITIDISGATPVLVNIPTGFYNIYQAINLVAQGLNDASGVTGLGFAVTSIPVFGGFVLTPSNLSTNYSLQGVLALQLGLGTLPPAYVTGAIIVTPSSAISLNRLDFLDFVSEQLTYNQDLKDASTQQVENNVLVRFYFCNETPEALDAYGFPIEMGYSPFNIRRTFNPPKQIKWSPNQPIGQLAFRVLKSDGSLVPMVPSTNWGMVLQVSEV